MLSRSAEHSYGRVSENSQAEIICWSRMQAESGQGLEQIVARKEREREAGEGLFFWGVGNAPSTVTRALAKTETSIPVIFSTMKSRPKKVDTNPSAISVWETYFDYNGIERPLPRHALITSKAYTASGPKKRHYALMCLSKKPLKLSTGVGFDPSAYRNCGANEGKIGPSQVTALVKKKFPFGTSQYEENLSAQLTGSYWVKLGRPTQLSNKMRDTIEEGPVNHQRWVDFVSGIRKVVEVQTFTKSEELLLI